MITRTRTQHTDRCTHEGREFTRTTRRVYTHAVVCDRVEGVVGKPCHEHVVAVHDATSNLRAHRAITGGDSRGVVVALDQPADVQAALRDILSQRAGRTPVSQEA